MQVLRSKLLDKIRFEYSFLDPVRTHSHLITAWLMYVWSAQLLINVCMCSFWAA